jgi:type III secretory pathway lipoprotein EscJ
MALGVLALSLGWAVWTLRDRPASEEMELLPGSVLPQSELAIMEAAFDRAQLTDHRTEGGRVYVPRARHSAYMRALVDSEALPREFGASLRRALASNGPWTSTALRADSLRVAIQDELSLVLCSMPGIERAAVLYDDAPRPGLAGGHERTASVSIRTQPDTELDPARVQAIRVLVASAIAGLPVERVAVTDLRSGRVFAGPVEATEGTTDPTRVARSVMERATAAKIRQSLGFIRGVMVDVTIGAASPPGTDPAGSTVAASPAGVNAPAAVSAPGEVSPTGSAPSATRSGESLHVLIAVPDTYFASVVSAARGRHQRRGAVGGPWTEEVAERAEAAEVERLSTLVATMLPDVANPSRTRIVVAPFTTGMAGTGREPAAEGAEPVLTPLLAWIAGSSTDATTGSAMRRGALLAMFSTVALALAAVLWRTGGAGRRGGQAGPVHGEQQPPATDADPRIAMPAAGPPQRWREAA